MDELFMKRCLELAILGKGCVAPNPMVGCVIVYGGNIIGEGYHEKFGEAHAEVNAISAVSDPQLMAKSTLYVNLEPCRHIGKTAACADLILNSNIPKVVIGCRDANPAVHGGGVEYLEENSCEVVLGMKEVECLELNRRFFTFHQKQRPYIILKWAESRDGFIAPADQKQQWITGDESKRLVHKWRTEEQAIMVGTNTAVVDNPALTARVWLGENPIRITVDNKGRIPTTSQILNDEAETIIYSDRVIEGGRTAKYVEVAGGTEQLPAIMADLHKREVTSLMVEGGQQLLNSFIKCGLWDEARVFTGTTDFIEGSKAPQLGSEHHDEEAVGDDTLRLYYNKA
ncbi:MAG TPA: bifunctional diaminohydroxyphosphoribosylaminopyrimidine deaminase/5-amino-6-(5-phosphoribosylamino)uracil reductase RibD [Flavobacteriales bacterium]|nr:bifunctional diaminohydroxyphosphoribosylaminopyrimidine deaminase/5-amino-6-(5-phosphoribosylamino)uracil reductase RibD [Flavobacteriales bacterium]